MNLVFLSVREQHNDTSSWTDLFCRAIPANCLRKKFVANLVLRMNEPKVVATLSVLA